MVKKEVKKPVRSNLPRNLTDVLHGHLHPFGPLRQFRPFDNQRLLKPVGATFFDLMETVWVNCNYPNPFLTCLFQFAVVNPLCKTEPLNLYPSIRFDHLLAFDF